MGAWYNRRLADAAALLNYLVGLGAATGTGVAVTRAQMATAMGWNEHRVDVIVRFLRENPQIGYGVTMRRGSPLVVVSTPHNKIGGTTLVEAARITQDIRLMNLWSLTRMESAYFVQWVNRLNSAVSPSEKAEARRHRKQHRKMLTLIQSGLDLTVPAERELDEFIDDVLNAT